MFEFALPWMFLVLPLPLLVRYLVPPVQQPEVALKVPFIDDFAMVAEAGALVKRANSAGLITLLLLIWVLAVVAAARPQWQGDAVPLPLEGRNLMLAVDLSGSMREKDFVLDRHRVSRLAATKSVAGEFIELRQGDRLGLILFGDQAYLQSPLTFDRDTVRTLLNEALINMAGKRTALGDAIGLAIKRLRNTPGDKVLILLSDGRNTAGALQPVKAAELAASEELKIYTIGVGAAADASFFGLTLDRGSDLDEETLKQIAQVTGGRYFRAHNTRQLVEIYSEIDQLEPIESEERLYRPVVSLFYWPLAGAVLLALSALALLLWREDRK